MATYDGQDQYKLRLHIDTGRADERIKALSDAILKQMEGESVLPIFLNGTNGKTRLFPLIGVSPITFSNDPAPEPREWSCAVTTVPSSQDTSATFTHLRLAASAANSLPWKTYVALLGTALVNQQNSSVDIDATNGDYQFRSNIVAGLRVNNMGFELGFTLWNPLDVPRLSLRVRAILDGASRELEHVIVHDIMLTEEQEHFLVSLEILDENIAAPPAGFVLGPVEDDFRIYLFRMYCVMVAMCYLKTHNIETSKEEVYAMVRPLPGHTTDLGDVAMSPIIRDSTPRQVSHVRMGSAETLDESFGKGRVDLIVFMLINNGTAASVLDAFADHNIGIVLSHLTDWLLPIKDEWRPYMSTADSLNAAMMAGCPIGYGERAVKLLRQMHIPSFCIGHGEPRRWGKEVSDIIDNMVEVRLAALKREAVLVEKPDEETGDPFQWIEI